VFCGFGPAGLDVLDRLDAELGHLHRVLLRGRVDQAVLDLLHAVAATVDRHDDRVLDVGRLQRLLRADRRRLVDRVDDVDGRFLVRQRSMAVRPPSSAPSVGSLQTIVYVPPPA
jgi:hypothetical protein